MQHDLDTSELVNQLIEIRDLHEQLLLAVRNKQTYMRSGNMNELESWSAREKFLIDCIAQGDQRRREISDQLAKHMKIETPATVSQLAASLIEPHRSRLLALGGAIRGLAEQVYQVNQVNDAVTREILECFAQMHRQFAASQCDLGLYDPNGRKRVSTAVNMLDAVG